MKGSFMKKRSVICLTAIIIISAMLTACGGKKPSNADAEPTTAPSEPATVAPVNEPETTPEQSTETGIQLKTDEVILAKEGTYSYLDYTFDIPEEWEQRVYICTYETSVCFDQRKSYEEHEGMGFMLSLDRSDNQPGIFTDGKVVAYNKDCVYFYMLPSDVPYVYDDIEIVDDYSDLMKDAYKLLDSWKSKDDSTKYDADEYICPVSDIKPIPEEVLENMYYTDLNKARREIYARHGVIFEAPDADYYFNSLTWYNGTVPETEFDLDSLSQVELDNIDTLSNAAYELFKDCPTNYQMGEFTKVDFNGTGEEDLVTVTVEGEPGWDYEYIFDINGNKFSSGNLGVYFEYPDDYFYITEIQPYYKKKQIAVVDVGMDDNHSTHFFRVDENGQLQYCGRVEGDAFANTDGNLDGFDRPGCVRERIRSYLCGVHGYYNYVWFNGEDQTINSDVDESYYTMHNIAPEPLNLLLKDIEVARYREASDDDDFFTMKAGEKVAFLQTDDHECVLLKSLETGKKGYLFVDDDINMNYSKYFERLD